MSAYREPTPLDEPYHGATQLIKKELSKTIENLFYIFEHEKKEKTSMSRLLHLHESALLSRGGEIGGKIYKHVQELMQACADYANGQGQIESVYMRLENLRADLRG